MDRGLALGLGLGLGSLLGLEPPLGEAQQEALCHILTIGKALGPEYGHVSCFSMANIGLPGTSSFIGEFLIIAGCFFTNTLAALFSALGMILGGGYSL